MARKRDTPCAGGCGRLLYGGSRGSLPPGVRCCRECRAQGQNPVASRKPAHQVAAEAKGCSVEGCPSRHLALGFCSSHYRKWRRSVGLEKSKSAYPVVHLYGMAFRFGAWASKQKLVKCRVTRGLVAECPNCDDWMAAVTAEVRICPSCGTEVRLNGRKSSGRSTKRV